MLRQEKLEFVKDISTLQLSPTLLKELKMAPSSWKKNNNNTAVSAGSRSTAPGGGPKACQRSSSQHTGKRKANELASSGESSPPTGAQNLALGPRLCPRSHQSQAKYLLSAAGNSRYPREGRCTRLYWPDQWPSFSQVASSSPQPWILTFPNPLSHPKQPIGACLATCPGL